MAVYQVYNNDFIGLTTDFKQAEEFLDQIDHEGTGSSKGIYLLKLNEETGKFESESFAEIGDSLRELTQEEKERILPSQLHVLNMNGHYEVEYDVYLTEESLLKDMPYYHEHSGEIFSVFGKYSDNFAAYILFENIVSITPSATFEEAIEDIEKSSHFIEEVEIGKLTSLDMKNMGDIYLPRINGKNLRKAYKLSQAFVEIMM